MSSSVHAWDELGKSVVTFWYFSGTWAELVPWYLDIQYYMEIRCCSLAKHFLVKCIHYNGYLVKDIMSLVMVMLFNHYDDHLYITMLAWQVITRSHSTLTFETRH